MNRRWHFTTMGYILPSPAFAKTTRPKYALLQDPLILCSLTFSFSLFNLTTSIDTKGPNTRHLAQHLARLKFCPRFKTVRDTMYHAAITIPYENMKVICLQSRSPETLNPMNFMQQ